MATVRDSFSYSTVYRRRGWMIKVNPKAYIKHELSHNCLKGGRYHVSSLMHMERFGAPDMCGNCNAPLPSELKTFINLTIKGKK